MSTLALEIQSPCSLLIFTVVDLHRGCLSEGNHSCGNEKVKEIVRLLCLAYGCQEQSRNNKGDYFCCCILEK